MYGLAGSSGFLNISLAPWAVMTTRFLTSTDPSLIGVKTIGVAAIAFRPTFTNRRLILSDNAPPSPGTSASESANGAQPPVASLR